MKQIEIDKLVNRLVRGYPSNLIEDLRQDLYLMYYELKKKNLDTQRDSFNYYYSTMKIRLNGMLDKYEVYEELDSSVNIEHYTNEYTTLDYIFLLQGIRNLDRAILEAKYIKEITEEEIATLYQDATGITTKQGINKYIKRIEDDIIRLNRGGKEFGSYSTTD